MKKQIYVIFPICLLLISLSGCRPPFGAVVFQPNPSGTAPGIIEYGEGGGVQRFVSTNDFTIMWCQSATSCSNPTPGPSPCRGTLTYKSEMHKKDNYTIYFAKCTLKTTAGTDTDKGLYYFIFKPKDGKDIDDVQPITDNVRSCTSPCKNILLNGVEQ